MHHEFFGLFLDEWASLIAIGSGIGGVITIVTRAVLSLKTSIDNLNRTLREVVPNVHDNTRRIDKLEDNLEIHIGEAKVRNQRITALEKEVFDHDKN